MRPNRLDLVDQHFLGLRFRKVAISQPFGPLGGKGGQTLAECNERLGQGYFKKPEPEELLIDEIEAIWARIADADDWTAFNEKRARIETARMAWGFSPASTATPTVPG